MFQAGTIPGAVSYPAVSLVNEDNTVKSRDEIEIMLRDQNVDPEKPMIFSCGMGLQAAFAL